MVLVPLVQSIIWIPYPSLPLPVVLALVMSLMMMAMIPKMKSPPLTTGHPVLRISLVDRMVLPRLVTLVLVRAGDLLLTALLHRVC